MSELAGIEWATIEDQLDRIESDLKVLVEFVGKLEQIVTNTQNAGPMNPMAMMMRNMLPPMPPMGS